MRGLSVEIAKITKIQLTPFEEEDDRYGISWDAADGSHGDDLIGTKAETESFLRNICRQQGAPGESAHMMPFPKDVAAS